MQIRTMTTSDISAAIELWRSCDGVGMSDSDTPEQIAAFLARNPGMSWVAVSDGDLAGTVLAGHDGRRGFLYHLAVATRARRQGIGRQLVDYALAALRESGILKCHTMVFRTNDDGYRFWSRLAWSLRDDLQVLSVVLDTGR
jgi:ribosomal protein S18 acetylase RimI-like enzyme